MGLGGEGPTQGENGPKQKNNYDGSGLDTTFSATSQSTSSYADSGLETANGSSFQAQVDPTLDCCKPVQSTRPISVDEVTPEALKDKERQQAGQETYFDATSQSTSSYADSGLETADGSSFQAQVDPTLDCCKPEQSTQSASPIDIKETTTEGIKQKEYQANSQPEVKPEKSQYARNPEYTSGFADKGTRESTNKASSKSPDRSGASRERRSEQYQRTSNPGETFYSQTFRTNRVDTQTNSAEARQSSQYNDKQKRYYQQSADEKTTQPNRNFYDKKTVDRGDTNFKTPLQSRHFEQNRFQTSSSSASNKSETNRPSRKQTIQVESAQIKTVSMHPNTDTKKLTVSERGSYGTSPNVFVNRETPKITIDSLPGALRTRQHIPDYAQTKELRLQSTSLGKSVIVNSQTVRERDLSSRISIENQPKSNKPSMLKRVLKLKQLFFSNTESLIPTTNKKVPQGLKEGFVNKHMMRLGSYVSRLAYNLAITPKIIKQSIRDKIENYYRKLTQVLRGLAKKVLARLKPLKRTKLYTARLANVPAKSNRSRLNFALKRKAVRIMTSIKRSKPFKVAVKVISKIKQAYQKFKANLKLKINKLSKRITHSKVVTKAKSLLSASKLIYTKLKKKLQTIKMRLVNRLKTFYDKIRFKKKEKLVVAKHKLNNKNFTRLSFGKRITNKIRIATRSAFSRLIPIKSKKNIAQKPQSLSVRQFWSKLRNRLAPRFAIKNAKKVEGIKINSKLKHKNVNTKANRLKNKNSRRYRLINFRLRRFRTLRELKKYINPNSMLFRKLLRQMRLQELERLHEIIQFQEQAKLRNRMLFDGRQRKLRKKSRNRVIGELQERYSSSIK